MTKNLRLKEGDEVILTRTREWSDWHRCVVTNVDLLGGVEFVPMDNSKNYRPMFYSKADAERFLRKVNEDG